MTSLSNAALSEIRMSKDFSSVGFDEYDDDSGPPQKSKASKRSKKAVGFKPLIMQDAIEVKSEFWAKKESAPEWKPTDEELPSYVMTGRLKHITPAMNKVVKIFLSSTFTDMYVERNYLFTNVYPELQKFCQLKYNLEFQVVDMRWGVRDEARQDHSGPATCMNELRSCQDLSLGPNFVCLLGQRYGNRPLQAQISAQEFQTIVESLESMYSEGSEERESIDLLKDWYKCDENNVPSSMILTPLYERDPPVEEKDFSDNISPKLHQFLRLGAQKAVDVGKMDAKDAKKYYWSVTEEEVYRGILSLSQEKARDHTLCFVRNITNVKIDHGKAYRFVELKEENGKIVVNQETTDLIEALVDDTKKHLGDENCHTFPDVEWSDKGGTNEESLKDYLEVFGKQFEEKVKTLITRAAEKKSPLKESQNSNLLTEIAEHDYQAIAKENTFQGRDDIMDKVKDYILSSSHNPFIMYGESGFGKTSLLAVASIRVYEWIGDAGQNDLVVIRRFLGTTPDSTNIGSLLRSVCSQLTLACRYKPPHTEDAMQLLWFTLIAIPRNFRVVIFLDSLDQLSAYGKAHTLAWLPQDLPENVKLIVSTLPKDHNILDLIRMRRYSGKQYVEVKILETSLAMKLMKDWLLKSHRQLTQGQFDIVNERFQKDANTSPLYIKLIYDVVLKMRSYMNTRELDTLLLEINSPIKCIRYIYNELKKKNGDLLVHRLFAYLHLSNLGLTENELVDLISLDDEVLNDVFQYHVPPLRRLPAVLWARIRNSVQDYIVTREANGGKVIAWYHRQFVEVGDTMFKEELPTADYQVAGGGEAPALCNLLRETMVDYFTGKWAGTSKPFQYTKKLMDKLQRKTPDDEKDRYVPAMPNILDNGRPNLRKLGQLPNLLIKLGRIEDFFTEVFGNIEGLTGLFSMYSWSDIYEIADSIDFDSHKAIGKDKDEVVGTGEIRHPFQILIRSFLLTSALACAYPKMLGPLVLGRLLPFAPGSKILTDFINGVYEKGPKLNSFVCPHVQLEGVGTYLIFEMPNDHIGSCVAMIEVVPKDHHYILTVSRKAVLINMEDGNIQLRYIPPDLRKDDSFHLVAAANAMKDPKEVIASLRIVPKIYIFSLSQFDIGEIIDCRQTPGCEEMRIQGLQMVKADDDFTLILAHGNAHDGMLVFNAKSQALLYRFQNNKPILFMTVMNNGFHIIQPKKQITISVVEKKKGKEKQQKADSSEPEYDFVAAYEYKLSLPGDSIITAKSFAEKYGWMAFATEDGHVYAGCGDHMYSKWTRMLLDSPATDVEFPQPGMLNDDTVTIGVCTKHYSYILYVDGEDADEDIHQIDETYRQLRITVLAKIKLSLSKLSIVNDTVAVGYHLGQLYLFKLESQGTDSTPGGVKTDMRLANKFDAHSRPITGVIVNEDVAAMVLTSAEDGSVRVFHAGLNVHPFLKESNTFDRMTFPIHRISSTSVQTASLSTESESVAVWDPKTAKITNTLQHILEEDEYLTDVVCFDEAIVTVTCQGTLNFWNVKSTGPELTEQISITDFHKMSRGCKPNEIMIKCKTSWHKFDAVTGDKTSEQVYDDRTILKHHYINGQLSLLQNMSEEEELVIEVIESEESCLINLSKEKGLSCDKFQDFFCCDHFLVLLYPRECIFYNWHKKDVFETVKLNKPVLIYSMSNVIALRSNCNVQVYKIDKGIEMLAKTLKLQQKADHVSLTPDGNHIIVIEQKKMLTMYKVGDLSNLIGQYSLYGEVERVAFTDDSAYIVMGIADTRLFYLMLCDVTQPGHHDRALKLRLGEFSEAEKKKGAVLVEKAGEEQSSDDDVSEEKMGPNLNELIPSGMERHLIQAESMMIAKNINRRYSTLKASRDVRRKKRVVETH